MNTGNKMLEHTFLHMPGIGITTEQRLWDCGIYNWDCLEGPLHIQLSPQKVANLRKHVDESRRHLKDNPRYFADRLPSSQHWRLFPEFRDTTVYLDIETTGMDGFYSNITTISLYDGESIYTYVRGQNLDEFKEAIARYKVIVTYNGKCFDVPFIERDLAVSLDQAHIDLRYVLRAIGFTGGLKGCEVKAGIDRGNLRGVDGYFAVLLWNEYERNGDERALETLLAYNIQDVVNLEALLVLAYNFNLNKTPFSQSDKLSDPVAPIMPFKGDTLVVDRIRNQLWSM